MMNLYGGAQERDTATSCVRQVFPSCVITPKCVDKYPIRVIIEANDPNGNVVVWEGDQKSLFRKYATRRKAAQEDIVAKLNALKASRL
ncbi:hypothetical protein ACHAXA_009016 [Cyclostephanos tholiformis]|uniref:Uncharacterized protein n=1 Tax=Cyclostephanos tholiformis TaxID=382380 RepID=A0ABD3RDJ0_9STRA